MTEVWKEEPIWLSQGLCVCVLSHFSHIRHCNPMDCSPPDSSVHRILQARILEWFAMPSSRGSSWPRDWTCISCNASGFFIHWTTKNFQEYISYEREISGFGIISLTLRPPWKRVETSFYIISLWRDFVGPNI